MKTWQQRMLNDFKKIAAFVERGVITKTEFIWQTLGMFAYYGPVDTGLIPELWPLVPESVRGEVSCAIREAASAATPWTLSGLGRDKTADDIQAERQSVKDWSQALLSHLETVPRCSGPV